MPDFHDALDDEARRVRSDPGALSAVGERADRRRRAKRLATGALALAVASGGIGLAFAAFRPGKDLRPASRPVPGPTITPEVEPAPFAVIVEAPSERVAGVAATMIEAEASSLHEGDLVISMKVVDESSPVTRLFCSGVAEPIAVRIRDSVFPGAELHGRIDTRSILVKVGQDFVRENRSLIAETPPAFLEIRAFVKDFLQARREASGAGTFLGEGARAAYASHEDGLDLLGYPSRADRVRITNYDKVSPDRHRVSVRFGSGEPSSSVVWETLLIGWQGGYDLVVLDAERGRPD